MADLSTAESVRALSQTEVNRLNNTQLKKALQTLITAPTSEEPSNTVLLNELKAINEKLKEINTLKEEVRYLSEKLNSAYESISQQQFFLEYLEGKERRKNLVIYGLNETPDALGNDDKEKLSNVLNKAQCNNIDPTNFVTRRLGDTSKKNRPLHVTLSSQLQRDTILRTAKELSKAGDHYSKVYINKDIHPAVRQEIGRLKKRAKEESDKSENSESNIIYDPKNRVVKKDGIIIDRFTPKFF